MAAGIANGKNLITNARNADGLAIFLDANWLA
jgi:hypothetical protein